MENVLNRGLVWGALCWLFAVGLVFAKSDSDASSIFITQPPSVSLSLGGEPVKLHCAVPADREASYQWYQSESHSNELGEAIEGANSRTFVTDSFPKREIRFYYCVAILSNGDREASNVAVVAYTGMATVEINTIGGEEPAAEYAYGPKDTYGRAIKNATKVPASMRIVSGKGIVSYQSGDYVEKQSGLTIKLRGNTSVNLEGKSSYKIKLQKKADLLASLLPREGDIYEDKEWILHKGTTTLDAFVGFTVCEYAGVPWVPKQAFVNVIINGEYRGFFHLMEAVNRSESRVDISKSGYIIERDAYWWNESVKFITPLYNQKFTFKYPDDDDVTGDQLSYIKNYVTLLEQHISDGSYDEYLDVESFARWLLIHDFLGTWDGTGSNIFMAKYDDTENSKLYMLTNWDFDSNYMQAKKWSNQHNDERTYAPQLFKSANRAFAEKYKSLYDSLGPKLWDKLGPSWYALYYIEGTRIDLSRYCDSVRWNDDRVYRMKIDLAILENWFVARKTWMENVIENQHPVSYEMRGGHFDTEDYPDSVSFLSRIEMPQPSKEGCLFAGWTSAEDKIPNKDYILYGYNVIDSVKLIANWVRDTVHMEKPLPRDTVPPHETFEIDLVLEPNGMESYSLEVFDAIGKFLGHITVDSKDMPILPRMLKKAGYTNGIYILRGTGLRKVLRIQVR